MTTSVPSGLPVGDLPCPGDTTTDLATPAVALAVGAHPDDVEFGCGATLAKWAARGCRVCHLVLTDGSKGTWEPDRDLAELVATREAEQRSAARALGGDDVVFCGFADGELSAGIEERRVVARWIRHFRPDVVLGHDPWRRYRLHPDHRAAGFLVTDALVAARDHHFFPEIGLAPHRPRHLLLFEPDEVNHVENVEKFANTKIDALLEHRSQLTSTMGIAEQVIDLDDARRDLEGRVRRQLRAHGAGAGFAAGEAFHRIDAL